MSDEYIDMDDHKKIVDESFVKGMLIGELRRLSEVHRAEPQTLWALQVARIMLGDQVQ